MKTKFFPRNILQDMALRKIVFVLQKIVKVRPEAEPTVRPAAGYGPVVKQHKLLQVYCDAEKCGSHMFFFFYL